MTILLTAGHVEEIRRIAKDALPYESCAFILGKNDAAGTIRVTEILPMRNADRSQVSFSIEPQEVLNAYELAEKKRLQVIGIFHSHPGIPAPSSTDKKFMEINPVVWLIYSTTRNRLKAYIYDIDVREVSVNIITE